MSTSRVEGEAYFNLDRLYFNNQVSRVIDSLEPKLFKVLRFYVLVNLVFLTVGFLELFFLLIFFAFLAKSSILAFGLALVFLTFFSYFIARIYCSSMASEQLEKIGEQFESEVKSALNYQEGIPEHSIALASAYAKFSESLQDKEYTLYCHPSLQSFTALLEQFSCWWHWRDVHQFRESLLKSATLETIKLVRAEPTSTEVHILLANAYVQLSRLYMDPRKQPGFASSHWIPPGKFTEATDKIFVWAAKKAIEELKIVSEYAPEDPWIHSQLAYSYHELGMFEEEAKEYETILKYQPQDHDSLFNLGRLYFEQGKNAKGLRIYEELKRAHYKKAETLIELYGTNQIFFN